MEHLCEVQEYGSSAKCPEHKPDSAAGCDKCRIGCFKFARFENPHYGDEGYFNYARWL